MKTVLYYFLFIPICVMILLGHLIFYITKPLRALSHLMMGDFSTAKTEITQWGIYTDITDAL